MKHTERINRINANLNKHFKSNNGAWWVNNEPYTNPRFISLHRGYGGDKIKPIWVAAYILRTEKSVDYVMTSCNCYTRETMRWAGVKI